MANYYLKGKNLQAVFTICEPEKPKQQNELYLPSPKVMMPTETFYSSENTVNLYPASFDGHKMFLALSIRKSGINYAYCIADLKTIPRKSLNKSIDDLFNAIGFRESETTPSAERKIRKILQDEFSEELFSELEKALDKYKQ
jgi:hypothetical protein